MPSCQLHSGIANRNGSYKNSGCQSSYYINVRAKGGKKSAEITSMMINKQTSLIYHFYIAISIFCQRVRMNSHHYQWRPCIFSNEPWKLVAMPAQPALKWQEIVYLFTYYFQKEDKHGSRHNHIICLILPTWFYAISFSTISTMLCILPEADVHKRLCSNKFHCL